MQKDVTGIQRVVLNKLSGNWISDVGQYFGQFKSAATPYIEIGRQPKDALIMTEAEAEILKQWFNSNHLTENPHAGRIKPGEFSLHDVTDAMHIDMSREDFDATRDAIESGEKPNTYLRKFYLQLHNDDFKRLKSEHSSAPWFTERTTIARRNGGS